MNASAADALSIGQVAAAGDPAHQSLVAVAITDSTEMTWYSRPLPLAPGGDWSEATPIRLDGASVMLTQPPILVQAPSAVADDMLYGIVAASNGAVGLFAADQTTVAWLPAPDKVSTARGLGAAGAYGDNKLIQVALAGEGASDDTRLYYATIDTRQWPPRFAKTWDDWGDSAWTAPAIGTGPDSYFVAKADSGNKVRYCWCYAKDLDYGIWWSVGGLEARAQRLTMAGWKADGRSQENAIFATAAPDGAVKARQKSKDGGFYDFQKIPGLTTATTPAPVPMPNSNVLPLLAISNGDVVTAGYWIKEDHWQPWTTPVASGKALAVAGACVPAQGHPLGPTQNLTIVYLERDSKVPKLVGAPMAS